MTRLITFALLHFWVLAAPALTKQSPTEYAYVVFNAQVVKVNIRNGRVDGRVEFFDHFGSVYSCALSPDQKWIVICRDLARDRISYAAVQIPTLRFGTPNEVWRLKRYVNPEEVADPSTDLVCETREISTGAFFDTGPRTIDLRRRDSRRLLGTIRFRSTPHNCRYENPEVAILTKDRRRLLLLMAGGFKEQSRLFCFTWPNLHQVYEIGLLDKLYDYSAITMYIPGTSQTSN
jgi:hypothetical protein